MDGKYPSPSAVRLHYYTSFFYPPNHVLLSTKPSLIYLMSSNSKPNTNGTNGKGKGKSQKRTKQAQEASVSQYHTELSAEYLQLTLYKDALRCANRALELDPKLLAARVRRGIARKNLGLLDAALADLDTVLSIDPSLFVVRELRDEIRLAKQTGRDENQITLEPVHTTQNDPDIAESSQSQPQSMDKHESNSVESSADKETVAAPSSSNVGDSDSDEEEDEEEEDDDDDDIMVGSVSSLTSSEKPPSSKVVEDYNLPYYDSSPQSNEVNGAQTPGNELDHLGNGTACRFYNHNGCNRGTTCTFAHAPDSKSVRDERGKNVCLYFLIGKCKWDNQSCIYSHSKAFLMASVSSQRASSDSASNPSQPFTLSASFAPLASSSSNTATRPPEGDLKGWWNNPERAAEIRELVTKRDEKGRIAHEVRVASFSARTKTKRSKKDKAGKNVTSPSIPSTTLDTLLNEMRRRYYEDDSDFDSLDYPLDYDTDLEDELEMEQRFRNGGFTDDEVMELLCQGVKPWDDDAGMVLTALSGDWY
ncbi:hypothetical protein D9758_003892 [Tetrapyrgos nigripes]|uniref:C3H1-type domain-containing protein n=1 Tax=Tetrapyrgos nigripes TaxID=182062 RepID=A0A8H5GLF4_9AGAR|nr:hypothetical protein D9758_003892 [Tetrapyrgos nigripes]